MRTANSCGRASARTCACCKWIVERARGRALGKETPIGWVPRYEDIEWSGLSFPEREVRAAAGVSIERPGEAEVIGHEELFIELHDHLPPEMIYERELLICRL